MMKRFIVLFVLVAPSAAFCAGGGHYTSKLPVAGGADLLLQDGAGYIRC